MWVNCRLEYLEDLNLFLEIRRVRKDLGVFLWVEWIKL